jgi:DnaJ-class molecular chaperone
MICQTCHGNGYVAQFGEKLWRLTWKPCPECGGCGETHCCDGHQVSEYDKNIEQEQDE